MYIILVIWEPDDHGAFLHSEVVNTAFFSQVDCAIPLIESHSSCFRLMYMPLHTNATFSLGNIHQYFKQPATIAATPIITHNVKFPKVPPSKVEYKK